MNLRVFALACLSLFPALLSQAQSLNSISEILEEYNGNVVTADAKYLGKPLVLSIKVATIEKDYKGEYYLVPVNKGKHVRCYFANGQIDALSKLKNGDAVALRGICRGFDRDKGGNHLVIAECKFGLADEPQEMKDSLAAVKRSLVILKGASGTGSGFVASIGGVNYVISNFHVFNDNEHLRLIDCDNREIEVKSIKFAPDRDIALFELEDQSAYNPLAMQQDIATLPIGTPVRVYGDSAGSGVFTEIGGKILGSGPSVIEVDAGFVGGNSGSPVLSFPSLKVLGVATYVTYRSGGWDTLGTRFSKAIRRFATRIDNLDPEKLEIYDKPRFDAEVKACQALSDLLNMKLYALVCLNGVGGGNSADNWSQFLIYSGKMPDSGRKTRLIALIQQWNKETKNLDLDLPSYSKEEASIKAASRTDRSTGKLGMDKTSTASINKLPFEDLNRLLFLSDPKPKFTYKRIKSESRDIADDSMELQNFFKERYENIKALLKK